MIGDLFETAMSTLEYETSPIRSRLSSIAGSIALVCWLVLIIPQLIEMFRVRDVEGISPLFLLSWAIGDIANVTGALWAGLLPEVIITALWFLFADITTLGCYFYLLLTYRRGKKHAADTIEAAEAGERQPLVADLGADEVVEPPTDENFVEETQNESLHAQQSRKSVRSKASLRRRYSSTVDDIVMEPERHSLFVRYGLPILFVVCAGTVGSFCSPNGGGQSSKKPSNDSSIGPQICGYISAFMYLTSRIPQIIKNYQNKSCKGLSLLFFLLSTLANLCYGLQILIYRSDWEYIWLNSSWILGSVGTIFEDCVIYLQFYLYNRNVDETAVV